MRVFFFFFFFGRLVLYMTLYYITLYYIITQCSLGSRDNPMGSVFLPNLRTGWHVDQAILSEDDRLVVIRFGDPSDRECMLMDEILYKCSPLVSQFAVIYTCDTTIVKDFNEMYELYDPVTVMFFYRNKHMMCDFGTGNNNKLNFLIHDKQEMIDILEVIYRGATKGKGLVQAPRDYSYTNNGRRD